MRFLNNTPIVDDPSDSILNGIVVEVLLSCLTEKERETIILWSQQKTLKQIAEYISKKYEGKKEGEYLTSRAMGVRVHQILDKLRRFCKEKDLIIDLWDENDQK